MTWYVLAIIAAAIFGANVLVIKTLVSQGISTALIMFSLYCIGTIASLIMLFKSEARSFLSWPIMTGLLVVGLLSTFGMIAQIKSIALAPNPGYSAAIISAQTLVPTILAIFLFGSPLTLVKGVGILLTLVGVALIATNN